MNYNLINIKNVVKNCDRIYAHKKIVNNDIEYETLEQHSNLVMKYYEKIDNEKQISQKVNSMIIEICEKYGIKTTEENLRLINTMFVNAVYLHDIGKSNPGFQNRAMKNAEYKSYDCERNHSLLSALMYSDFFVRKIKEIVSENKYRKKLYSFVVLFSYIISRHHSHLENVDIGDFRTSLSNIKELDEEMLVNYQFDIDKAEIKTISIMDIKYKEKDLSYMYVLSKLLYSVLVTCDFAATYEFMNNKEAEIVDSVDKTALQQKYENEELIKAIRARNEKTGINKLRTDIFHESQTNLCNNLDKSIFYLEAPTGSGKTITSINLALNLQSKCNLSNIFYVFPFNTLAEQTSQVMKFWQTNKDFVVFNSTTPISSSNNDENSEYEKIYFNYQLANYPVVISSHVRFFDVMFGTNRESTIWLYKLCNSVIILDEIQSYSIKIWSNFINLLTTFSKALNIKIVIMSATLPKLSYLVKDEATANIVDLIDSEKYYQNEIFKNRVKIDYSLLKKEKIEIKYLYDKFTEIVSKNKGKKILIEFIKKSRAREFYTMLKDYCGSNNLTLAELSGDDNKSTRKAIIADIKAGKIDIVVATQVIEAGVDIDMDIGFKDISILDSEEQFMGRINRSCKRDGLVYFFNLDNATGIYRGDVRTENTLLDEGTQEILSTKNFSGYFDIVLNKLKKISDGYDFNKNLATFKNDVGGMKYKEVQKALKLIDTISFQIVLNFKTTIDGKVYSGKDCWEKYKELLLNKDKKSYSEVKIKLSQVNALLDNFTFSIIGNSKENQIKNFTESIGDLYYFENGEEYITEDGKFDRDKFNKTRNEVFL